MRTIDRALFVEQSGATIVSRGGRLYLRYRGEYDELDMTIRTVIASGMGFVITSDAMRACTKKHIEMIITDATQSFVAIYGFYVPGKCKSFRYGGTHAPIRGARQSTKKVVDRQRHHSS